MKREFTCPNCKTITIKEQIEPMQDAVPAVFCSDCGEILYIPQIGEDFIDLTIES